jgi:hypothetical protein
VKLFRDLRPKLSRGDSRSRPLRISPYRRHDSLLGWQPVSTVVVHFIFRTHTITTNEKICVTCVSPFYKLLKFLFYMDDPKGESDMIKEGFIFNFVVLHKTKKNSCTRL